MLLETYTSLDDEGIKKCLPKFLNVVEEVTGKPEYSMFNLSLKEEWKNSKKYCNDMPGKQSLDLFGLFDTEMNFFSEWTGSTPGETCSSAKSTVPTCQWEI
jgi:hypothetical protein